jgi:hypothetical protein
MKISTPASNADSNIHKRSSTLEAEAESARASQPETEKLVITESLREKIKDNGEKREGEEKTTTTTKEVLQVLRISICICRVFFWDFITRIRSVLVGVCSFVPLNLPSAPASGRVRYSVCRMLYVIFCESRSYVIEPFGYP